MIRGTGFSARTSRRLSMARLWSTITSHSSRLPAMPRGSTTRSRFSPTRRGRAGEDPGRGMTGVVEEIGLDHQNRPHLARLGAGAWVEVGQVEDAATGLTTPRG